MSVSLSGSFINEPRHKPHLPTAGCCPVLIPVAGCTLGAPHSPTGWSPCLVKRAAGNPKVVDCLAVGTREKLQLLLKKCSENGPVGASGHLIHSSILAWRIPWTRSLVGCDYGLAQSRTRLSDYHSNYSPFWPST